MTTLKGTFKHGLKVGEAPNQKVHKDYELRPHTTADIFAAEREADPSRKLAFRGALVARQLVRLGELSGPLDIAIIEKLHPDDYWQLCEDMDKVDDMGNGKSGD